MWWYWSSYAFHHPGNHANMLYYDGHVASIQSFMQTGKYVWNCKYPCNLSPWFLIPHSLTTNCDGSSTTI